MNSKHYATMPPEIPFPDWHQTVSAHYGNGTVYKMYVPSYLHINKGMNLPSDNTRLPRLQKFNGELPSSLIPFHEARAQYNKGVVSEASPCFYIDDKHFNCLLGNPLDYSAMLKDYKSVVSPDFSVYRNYSFELRKRNTWVNYSFAELWQVNGMSVIINVVWSGPDSYEYAFAPIPRGSVIAINSSGVKGDSRSTYYWMDGYKEMLKVVKPERIIRYGEKMPGEAESISTYYPNPYLTRMRHGR